MDILPAPTSIHFRSLQQRDLAAVYELEKLCQSYPWPLWWFRKTLRGGASGWLLEIDGRIIGFGILRITRARAHILNMCVTPEYRHRGLGRRILLRLLVVARKQHARQAWLEVRATNRTAILLYRKLGFHMQAIRKHYYLTRTGRENAIVMARKL